MQRQNETQQVLNKASVGKCALVGAGIALLLISLFLSGVKHPDPAWGKFWFIRPLVVVSLAGATGGVIYFFTNSLRSQGGWKKFTAIILSVLIYIFGLWIGTVLGLNGTLWN